MIPNSPLGELATKGAKWVLAGSSVTLTGPVQLTPASFVLKTENSAPDSSSKTTVKCPSCVGSAPSNTLRAAGVKPVGVGT